MKKLLILSLFFSSFFQVEAGKTSKRRRVTRVQKEEKPKGTSSCFKFSSLVGFVGGAYLVSRLSVPQGAHLLSSRQVKVHLLNNDDLALVECFSPSCHKGLKEMYSVYECDFSFEQKETLGYETIIRQCKGEYFLYYSSQQKAKKALLEARKQIIYFLTESRGSI